MANKRDYFLYKREPRIWVGGNVDVGVVPTELESFELWPRRCQLREGTGFEHEVFVR